MERLVVAFETIANVTVISTSKKVTSAPPPAAETTGETTELTKDYEKVAKMKDGRKTLFNLCKSRGIDDIKPQSRTDTLISKLRAWDMANPAPPVNETTSASSTVEQDKDPFADDTEDADPFADDDAAYTEGDVRTALTDWMKEEGKNRSAKDVVAILREHAGGVTKFSQLTEEHYPSVMAAIHA